ncbi:ATP-binding protein [Roseomonas sp. SG15]|uniref:ATP-binding protein n=1 Tax=Roseomonas indoligenes TaxID=2820811 RepID=A0A940MZ52_9PROT|nr:ATP-binding protein [Pararoseomonas indoligenes]
MRAPVGAGASGRVHHRGVSQGRARRAGDAPHPAEAPHQRASLSPPSQDSSLDRDKILTVAQLSLVTRSEVIHSLGPPGTGKSHLAIALGVRAVRADRSVHFCSLADLLGQLARAERKGTLANRIQFFCRSELLIVDEIGYLPVMPGGGDLIPIASIAPACRINGTCVDFGIAIKLPRVIGCRPGGSTDAMCLQAVRKLRLTGARQRRCRRGLARRSAHHAAMAAARQRRHERGPGASFHTSGLVGGGVLHQECRHGLRSLDRRHCQGGRHCPQGRIPD